MNTFINTGRANLGILLAILGLSGLSIQAQRQVTEAWVQRYHELSSSGDWAMFVAPDSRGDVIVTGTTDRGILGSDILTIKYSGVDGTAMWSRRNTDHPFHPDKPSALVLDARGNAIIAGKTSEDTSDDYYIVKHASGDGAVLWEQIQGSTPTGGDLPVGFNLLAAVDGEGNVFLATIRFGNFGSDSYIAKLSAAEGRLLWEKRHVRHETHDDSIKALTVDAQGNLIVIGRSHFPTNGNRVYEYYTAKYAGQDGRLMWEDASHQGGHALATDGSGNVIVAGSSTNEIGSPNFYTAKLAASDGRLLWRMSHDMALVGSLLGSPVRWTEFTQKVTVDGAGSVLVTGISQKPNGDEAPESGFYTVKYSADSGEVVWEQFRPEPVYAFPQTPPQSISVDQGGNVLVTGFVSASRETRDRDYYSAKYAAEDGRLLWEQSYDGPAKGHDVGRAAVVDTAGNLFVTGESDGGSSADDFYTAKYAAADGALLWQQRYIGSAEYAASGNAVTIDQTGNVVVTGHSGSKNYTAKYSAIAGDLLWERRFGNQAREGQAVRTDSKGDVLVAGSNFVAKYAASDGAVIWGLTHNVQGQQIQLDTAGNVLLAGRVWKSGSALDYYTAKISRDGALIWAQQYNGPGQGSDEIEGIAVDGDGNAIVTGTSYSVNVGSYYTAKYSGTNGELIWERRYSGSGVGHHQPRALAVDSNGNVVVTGRSTGNWADYNYYTAKYSSASGDLLWERRYNGPNNDYDGATALAVDAGGNVLVTGDSPGELGSIYTVKYAGADGSVLWDRRSDAERAIGVAVDAGGNVVVAGMSYVGSNRCCPQYFTTKLSSTDGALLWERRLGGRADVFYSPSGLAIGPGGTVAVTGSAGIDMATVFYRETLPPVLLDPESAGVRLRFKGEVGRRYLIQRATALSDLWSTLATSLADGSGGIDYLDTSAPAGAAFYRITEQD